MDLYKTICRQLRIRKPPCHFLLLTVIAQAIEATAQETPPELVTDRPDQTESTSIVLPGYYQIETGITYTDAGGHDQSLEGPATLVRIGALDGLELRLAFTGWTHLYEDEDDTGWNDAEAGIKIRLWDESGLRPEAALLVHVSLPVGDHGYSTERADPSFRFSFAHTLHERVSLGYNLGASWATSEQPKRAGWLLNRIRDQVEDELVAATDPIVTGRPLATRVRDELAGALVETTIEPGTDRDTLGVFEYTLATGIAITDRLGMYVEFFGDVPMSADGGPAHYFDGGFTYALRPNVQFDIEGGIGLNGRADDWFAGIGVSVRLPR